MKMSSDPYEIGGHEAYFATELSTARGKNGTHISGTIKQCLRRKLKIM